MAIRKIDYYVGALLSYLINKHERIDPSLFDSSEDSKIVRFDTDNGKFNLFVKSCGKAVHQKDGCARWVISITSAEYKRFTESFCLDGYKNLFVVVCSSGTLTQTEIAVLPFDDALKCMGTDIINEQRRVTIKSVKGSKFLHCYGTGLSDMQAIKILRNIDKQF